MHIPAHREQLFRFSNVGVQAAADAVHILGLMLMSGYSASACQPLVMSRCGSTAVDRYTPSDRSFDAAGYM